MKKTNQVLETKPNDSIKKPSNISLESAFNAKHKTANDFIKKVKLSF